jgi:hypothetical protein
MFLSGAKYVGIAPEAASEEVVLVIIEEALVPYLLRLNADNHWLLISGDYYV